MQITQMPLDIQQRVLGSELPGTMKTSRNLAACLRAAHGTATSSTRCAHVSRWPPPPTFMLVSSSSAMSRWCDHGGVLLCASAYVYDHALRCACACSHQWKKAKYKFIHSDFKCLNCTSRPLGFMFVDRAKVRAVAHNKSIHPDFNV